MPAVVQHLSGLVDALDVASAGEMRIALDTPMPADHVSFAGPGKTPAELRQAVAAGVTIEMESATEAERVIDDRRAARHPPARRRAGQPRLPGQGLGHADGRRPAAVRRRRRAGAGAAARAGRRRPRVPRLPHLRRLAEPATPRSSARRSARPSTLALRLADERAGADPLPEPRRRLRHPLLRPGRAARPRARSATTSSGLHGRRDPPEPARGAGRRSSSAATSSASAAST